MKIHGREFRVVEGPQDYWGWVAEGRYDGEWKLYDEYLKPEHTFLDLGAWVGAHSLYAAAVARVVVAVEPDPVAREILAENLAGLERRLETYVLGEAVSDEAGTVKLGSGCLGASTTRRNLAAGGGIGEATETFDCRKVALRELAKTFADPLFVKMDIEGMEEEVLRDGEFFKERRPAMLIELHPFWWEDERKTWKDFEVVKAFYKTAFEIPNSKTWFLDA